MNLMDRFYNLSIDKKVGLFFGQLIVLVIVTYLLITYANTHLRVTGASLEIARRNQTVSLQLGYMAPNLAAGHQAFQPKIAEAIKEFEQNQLLLQKGGDIVISESMVSLPPIPEELNTSFNKTEKQWAAYKSHLQALLQMGSEKDLADKEAMLALDNIREQTPVLLAATKDFANEYVRIYIRTQTRIHLVIFSLCLLNLLFLISGIFLMKKLVSRPLKNLIRAAEGIDKGNLQFEFTYTYNDEVGSLGKRLRILKENLKETTAFAHSIGQGRFEHEFEAKGEEDELSLALLDMRTSLKKVAEEDRRRNWTNEGMASFSNLLRNQYKNVEEMADATLSFLVKYLNANQGSFFTLEKTDHEQELRLIAAYAYNRKKYLNKTIAIGEGLVGQAVLEKDSIYLTEIPDNYIRIRSGLGEASPTNVLIMPLMINEEVFGVLELASFHRFEQYQVDFVKELSESIASSLSNAHTNEQTKHLLDRSQEMTLQLKDQEEEMRQNLEEMLATQEEMERKNKELEVIEQRFNQLSENLDGMLYQLVLRPDRSSRFLFVSAGAYKLLGFTPEEMVSAPNSTSILKIAEEHKAGFQEALTFSAQKQTSFKWEGKIYTKTGQLKWISARSQPLHYANGEIVWNGLITDITELKEKASA